MDYGHDLAFGTFLTPQNRDPGMPVRLARLTESAGLDLVSFQDHPYQSSFLDTWTLLTWVAASTERVHVATNVLSVPTRLPALVARSAASLDLLSGGRLALGIGAGAFWDAIAAIGGTRLTTAESVVALGEAIDIIRGIWNVSDRTPLRVEGEHHAVDGAKRGPAPAHDVPLWIGAYRPRMLRLTAQKGDGWLPSLTHLRPGDLARGNALIDDEARAVGRDPSEVRRLLNIGGRFAFAEGGARSGAPARWAEDLTRLALDDGVGSFILATDDPRDIQVFGEEVAPAVRDAVDAERRRATTPPSWRRRGTLALAARRDRIAYDDIPPSLGRHAVEPGDRDYEQVRSTYLRTGAPGLVLRPRTSDEVAEAVVFAAGQPVALSVRSGGHGIGGRSTNDGGIVIDLGAVRGVEILDDLTRRVRIGVGESWGEVMRELSPRRWAISAGDYGGAGVGGVVTTGGMGLLARPYGLAVDHVVAAEVVTADGTVRRVDTAHDPDLFWALRGAGGSVGVVTHVEIEAAPVGDVVHSVMTVDAIDTAGFIERWAHLVETSPRYLTSFVYLRAARGRELPVAQVVGVYASDDTGEAVRCLDRLATAAPVLGRQSSLAPYSAVVPPVPRDHARRGEPVFRSGLFERLTPGAAFAIEDLHASGVVDTVQIRAIGAAVNDIDPDAMAYAHRTQNFCVSAQGAYPEREKLDAPWDATVRPLARGLYTAFDTDPRPERWLDAYPEKALARLRDVKATYDPRDMFGAPLPVTVS